MLSNYEKNRSQSSCPINLTMETSMGLAGSIRSGAYSLVGPEPLGGERTAANWSAALGREVRYSPSLSLTDSLLEEAYGGRKALDF